MNILFDIGSSRWQLGIPVEPVRLTFRGAGNCFDKIVANHFWRTVNLSAFSPADRKRKTLAGSNYYFGASCASRLYTLMISGRQSV
jgi:hypothetical protein